MAKEENMKKSKVKYTRRTPGVGRKIRTYTVNVNDRQRGWWVRVAKGQGVSKSVVIQKLIDMAMEDDERVERLMKAVMG